MQYLSIFVFFFQEILLLKTWSEVALSNHLKIIRPPKDYFPKSGNLQLSCEAEGDPMPTIIWYNGKTNTTVDTDKYVDLKLYSDQSLLIINNPTERMVYEFYCNVSNNKRWVISRTAKTGLSYLSVDFEKQPQSIVLMKETQTVILFCDLPIGSPPPKLSWLKNKKTLLTEKYIFHEDIQRFSLAKSDNFAVNNNSLQIANLKLSDSGRYQCVAINDYQRLESRNSWLLVVNSKDDRILDINIKQLSQKPGDNIEMACNSNEQESIRWISSKEFSKTDLLYLFRRKFLKKNLKQEDRAIYACETNETNSKLLNVFNLSVSESVEEKLRIQKKTVIEGVNVMLECDLDNTEAEFYWETPQSLPIFPNDYNQQRLRVTKDGYLHIANAQSSDSGKYTCNVHSSLDVKHKSIWLEISKHQLDIYPVISLPAQNVTVLKGSSINLKCEVIGEDIIKILWYSGLNIRERLISSELIYFPTKESLLIVNADQKRNTNFYTCEAVNEQGLKAGWTAFVDVTDNFSNINQVNMMELPLPPVVESPKNIKSNSLELIWSSSNNPQFKVTYWIEYVHFGSKTGWEIYKRDWPHTFISVDNLKPDTWYQFLVRSKNAMGIGRASVPTEYVKTKFFMSDEPYSGNIGFQFSKIRLADPEIVNGHQIQLKWLINRDDNDNAFKTSFNTQFYLNYKPISILKCVADKSNGYPYESILIPTLNDYCSLKSLNSEKLRMLNYKYSPIEEKTFQIPIDFSRINISKCSQPSPSNYAQVLWLIDNVTFFHCYNISISSKSENKPIFSNNKLILIPETKPGRPPDNIHISWMLPDIAINIKWDLPDRKYWNGILTGANIYMKSNESEIVLKFNDTQSNKVITQVNSNLNWWLRVSLENCVGESVTSPPMLLHRLSDAILSKSENLMKTSTQKINLFKKSWMIATLVVTSVLIWLMLSFLTIYLCCSKTFKFSGHKLFHSKTSRNIEIINNKDFKDGLIINPLHKMEKENHCNDSNIEKTFNTNNLSLSPASSNSFCNPYASTQIFEPSSDKTEFGRSNWMEPEGMNLYYLSTPIFDALSVNDAAQSSINYFLSNNQEWAIHQNATNQNHLLQFSIYPPHQDDSKTSETDLNFETMSTPRKEQSVELSILKNNGTINNLLISTAPFSDQFTATSKSKSTNNSSNSDSSFHQHNTDNITRLKKSNNQSKSNKRRHDPGDFLDQSTEMTHLLANVPDKRSPFTNRDSNRVYDIPYSESVLISEKDD